VSYLSGGRLAYMVVAGVLLSGPVGCSPIPSDYEQAGANGVVSQGADTTSGITGVRVSDGQVGRMAVVPDKRVRNVYDVRSIDESPMMGSETRVQTDDRSHVDNVTALSDDLNPSDDDTEFNDVEDESSERGGLRTAATGSLEEKSSVVGSGALMTREEYLISQQNAKR